MYFPSLLQKYWVTGRLMSLVISFAAVHGSLTPFTQMLRVSLYGLRNEMYFPSGDICAPEISGLPKNSSRSMSGGSLPVWAGRNAGVVNAIATARGQRRVCRARRVTGILIGKSVTGEMRSAESSCAYEAASKRY